MSSSQPSQTSRYDEDEAYMCACKGEPYTAAEWASRVRHLLGELQDAQERLRRAELDGACMPARFED